MSVPASSDPSDASPRDAPAREPSTPSADRSPSKWTVFSIVAIGVLMATIDSSIVNVSLPIIARDFGVRLGGEVEWVVIGYLVVVAALLLTAGRLADLFGRKRTWATGLIVFTLGSALCGAAPWLGALVGFRALQGIGGALLMAVSPAMIVGAFPGHQRGRALGMNAVVVGTGVSAGPTLGGIITQHLGWRWIFYVNVPLGACGLAATLRYLPREGRGRRARLDVRGALLLALGLGALTATMSFASELRASHPWLLVAGIGVAVAALVGLVAHLVDADEPLLDPGLFRSRVFASASASLLLSFTASFAVAFLMPFYLEQLRGWRAERAGLLLTPLPLTIALISPWTGTLADRVGTRKLASTGLLMASAGLASLGLVRVDTPVPQLVANLVFIGVGQAVFQPPNNSALMGEAPRERQGVAAGVLATARVVGQSLSVSVASVLFATFGGAGASRALQRGHAGTPSLEVTEAFLRGMHAAFFGCAAIALTASIVALGRGRERPATRAGP